MKKSEMNSEFMRYMVENFDWGAGEVITYVEEPREWDKEYTRWIQKTNPLNKALEEHKLWLHSGGELGARVDLPDANLMGIDLSGANLEQAEFLRANLTGANLSGANLQRAYFWKATLSYAKFAGANLTEAVLTGADLTGAEFDANLCEVDNFANAIVSNDQLPLLISHPRFCEFCNGLTIV